jgi:UMF1 family MFS transporter
MEEKIWNRKVLSWMFYDWANSAFATTIMAGFFPIFFKVFWSAQDEVHISTAKLASANSLAGIIIALSAPILGAIADRSGKKIKFLMFFTLMGSTGSFFLYFVNEGNWQFAILFYVIASLGFFSSNIFYDSMLVEVSPKESHYDIISSAGFAFGYLGGGILFSLNVLWFLFPENFGFDNKADAVKTSFLSVSIWWILFATPLIISGWKGNSINPADRSFKTSITSGFKQIIHTFHEIKHLKPVFTFLIAYWLYIDGVDTIIRMASDYGLSIGFQESDLIIALLLIQFFGFPFTFLIGFLASKAGRKKMIFFTIFIYIIICIWASFIKTKYEFYGIALLISTVQGGIQALSRSYFASLIPVDKSAEYFGFYNMLGKFAVIFGPILLGTANIVAGYFVTDKSDASRIGILSIVLLFVAGAFLLTKVDDKKAKVEKIYL